MVTYESLREVPPELGTRTDWRTYGRSIPPDAQPDAHVKLPRTTPAHTGRGGQSAPLYRIENTRPIPDLTQAALDGLRRAQNCAACGQVRRNPLGKIMLPGRAGVCAMCQKNDSKKGHQ